MTETTNSSTIASQDWWSTRFAVRYPESGPPLFRRRSAVYRRKSVRVDEPFPTDLAARLSDLSPNRRHALFLAAVAAVSHRYQEAVDPGRIVVGSPVPSGAEPGAVLPLLVEVTAEATFESVIDAAASSIAESYARPDCSLPDLLAALGMEEVTDRHPLFPVVLRVAGYHPRIPDLRNDITVTVGDAALEIEYNANVRDEATVRRFGRHVRTFLERGLAEPLSVVRAVEYRTDDERELIEAWSNGPVAPWEERCVHALFEAEAAARPEREALVFGTEVMSYGELNERANRLANHLGALGAGSGSRIGLCIPASPELLIGALGVLKSGAAVVPLVPTFPASRNQIAVVDAELDVVVTDSSLRHRFTEPGPAIVSVDQDAEEIARAAATNPATGATADDPVYLMFTSGSTGRPKGAVLEHRTLVNLVTWQRERGVDPVGRRTLQRTSIGFDVSFQEIFSTLGFGGSLVVAPDDVRDDVSLLPEYVERYGITRLFLPPVALNQMAVTVSMEQRSLATLDEVIVAGEQLQVSMPIRRLFHQLDCVLDNQYGPTETHVVTGFLLRGPSTRWAEMPPIGRPVRNVRVRILDAWLRPVPAGVPGELYVGGLGEGNRYLEAEENGGRFVSGPGDERLYRTGDRARFLADGDIEFLGRRDDQVKIRGYRIELGEVEANLLRVPGVRRAAATVHETEALGKQLVAYIVTDEESDPVAIRQLLLEALPGHMVPTPSSIVRMTTLPLTATGKVDRRELPPPPRSGAAGGSALAEGGTEETVAKIWAQGLGLVQVGRDVDFLELGGHSLVGIQIVAQLNELYGVSLPLRSILRGTTVAALAGEIEKARGLAEGDTPLVTASGDGAPEVLRELGLPDGRVVHCLQPAETQYLYLDVFGHRTYDRGGIRYPDTGVVFDVGAHIGLFTLFALERSPGLRIFAFEPCPPLFEALGRNTERMAGVRRFPFGLGATSDTAELTFYPNLTGMSSFHPDDEEERALLSGILENLAGLQDSQASGALAGSREYLDERLRASTFSCRRRTLSEVLAETGVDRVSLLKIDVQKAELEVLRGIAAADWPMIDQLAIELHDLDGRLAETTSLLESKGYRVTVEQDALHAGTAVHFVYAVRS